MKGWTRRGVKDASQPSAPSNWGMVVPHGDGGHEGHTDLGEGLKLRRLRGFFLCGQCRRGQAHMLWTTLPRPRKPGDHHASAPHQPRQARPRAPEPQSPGWGGGRVGGGGAQGTLVQCTPWKRQLKTPLKAEVTLPLL